ncbi:MAG: hypothetical protein V4622_10330 [Bacteroidota bacterium]
MKIKFLYFFLIFTGILFSQNNISLDVHCVDKESKNGIYEVQININQKGKIFSAKTNKKGEAVLTIDEYEPFTIEILHGFYQSIKQEIKPENYPLKENPTLLEFELTQKFQQLKTVNVTAAGIPQIVYESRQFSVSDFEFLPNGELLLLLYPKTLKKGSELAILSENEIIKSFKVPEKPLELVHDFRGNAQVVCENGVFGIHRTENDLGISTIEKSYFLKYVFPIVDTSYTKYYFSNFNKNYPAFDYKTYDLLDSSYSIITEIKDEFMMELYRSEYKWVDVRTKLWAKNLENETGIDKEIWVGANYFTQSIYYKELYAPMFKKNDSIFVFDYYKDKLFTFNLNGEKVDSIPIYHHYNPKESGWRRKLLQDKETGIIYAFFEKDGICSLRKVNTKTGFLDSEVLFQHKYIDKIAINGNQAYYIYRPFESAQKKFLYQTKLP